MACSSGDRVSQERADDAGHDAYAQELADWRAERDQRLRSDTGWLTLVGLFPLEEGDQRFGSAPDNDIIFPSNAPDHAGVFRLSHGDVTLEAAPGIEFHHGEETVREVCMIPDVQEEPTVLDLGRFQLHALDRAGRKYIRLKDRESEVLRDFQGIESFPVDPSLRIDARWEPYDPPKPIQTPNILGYTMDGICPGAAVFNWDGQTCRLEPTGDPTSSLFFVFGDRTNRHETHGGGRFLVADPPDETGMIRLDFNKAYNPPCVFTPYATCPLPCPENVLPVEIRAGERMYGAAH
jgi:uncharacterized protein (DUF1684 family)